MVVGVVLSWALAALAVLIATILLYTSRNHGYWRKRGIPELKPLPVVGTMLDVALGRKNAGAYLKEVYEQHKDKPFIGLYGFDQPVLQVHTPEIIRSILVKDGQNFLDRSLSAGSEKVDPMAARSLFGLKGQRWKAARNALSPSFTSGKMKRMYSLVKECGRNLVEAMSGQTNDKVEVYEVAARYTTDSIASCAFGIEGNALKNPDAEFRQKLRLFFVFSPIRALAFAVSFFAPRLIEILRIKILDPEAENFVRETIGETVAHREKNGVQRGDFLDSLIELRREQEEEARKGVKNGKKLSEYLVFENEDLLAHAGSFLSAGFETSATTISYTLYELALNQVVQDKLRKEIVQALDGAESLSYENLFALKYLDMVLMEVLRKYPALPNLDRMNVEPYTIPGTDITLPPGTRIAIPLHAIQMDPQYFPNPKKFDPERFSDENKHKILNYTHMPFGEGPRQCAGKRFAVMQVKSGLVDLLSKFSVHPCPETPKEVEFTARSFLLQPKTPIKIVFKKL